MLKKTRLFLCVLLITSANGFGQNVYQLTQYTFDPLSYNPALAGSDQGFAATLLYRKQWVGFEGAPSTGLVNAHLPLPKQKSGVGLTILNDQIGNFNFSSISPSYSYKYRRGLNVLHLGIAPVYYSGSLKDNWISISDKSEDPAIPNTGQRSSTFDLNCGIFYKAGKYFAGFSVVNVVGQRVQRINLNLSRTFFLNGGVQFKLPFTQAVDWTAGFNLRSDMKNTKGSQLDLNLTGLIREAFWIGINYRTKDSFSPLFGYQKYIPTGKIRLGYAYDYTISGLNKYNSGSHEVAINYVYFIDKPRENEKYKNVRFL